ncbi:MAG TPA: hypothetical protein VJT15_21090 [Pyrinomonadaceae bacterium]|nr:hypothetical protein [Pyrinomonadaceae bacterium]
MALSDIQKQLRKRIYQRLADEALAPGNPLYEPLYENHEDQDPVNLLYDHIELSGPESLQLFSGFRGSGKTTELLRLKRRLEEEGFLVLYSDALEYVNPSEPIDISDFLIALGGAFNDALLSEPVFADKPLELAKNSYWQRISNFLQNTAVGVNEGTLKTSVTGPVSAGIDLKLELKTSPTFRQNVQKFLASRIGELRNEAHRFFEDGVKEIRKFFGEDKQVVFIFDSLEQLRGSLSNEKEVLQSIERLFANHLPMLRIPYIHAVYTVPPWFKFVKIGGPRPPFMLPSIRQWDNDDARSRCDHGCSVLNNFIRKRFGDEGYSQFFGPGAECDAKAEKLADVCGGHFRDLLRLLREAVLRADTWPVSDEILERARLEVRGDYLPIAIDDAIWLAKIGELRECALPSVGSDDVNRLTRFLDTHFVLYLKNGDEWYDIHPLIREEVDMIVERHKASSGDKSGT